MWHCSRVHLSASISIRRGNHVCDRAQEKGESFLSGTDGSDMNSTEMKYIVSDKCDEQTKTLTINKKTFNENDCIQT